MYNPKRAGKVCGERVCIDDWHSTEGEDFQREIKSATSFLRDDDDVCHANVRLANGGSPSSLRDRLYSEKTRDYDQDRRKQNTGNLGQHFLSPHP